MGEKPARSFIVLQLPSLVFVFLVWEKGLPVNIEPLLSPKQSELVSTFCEFLREGEVKQRLL